MYKVSVCLLSFSSQAIAIAVVIISVFGKNVLPQKITLKYDISCIIGKNEIRFSENLVFLLG